MLISDNNLKRIYAVSKSNKKLLFADNLFDKEVYSYVYNR